MATSRPGDGRPVPGAAATGRYDLLTIVGVVALALLIWVVPWWGIYLHTDVIPTYRLQVSAVPPSAVPYGLQIGTLYPMGSWEACVEQYRAFTRFNCVDVLLFRATAWVGGGNAEIWRLIYFALNAAGVALLVLAARAVGAPRTLAAALGLCLIAGPMEIWGLYHTSEPKATLFLLGALVLALGRSTVGRSALAAVLMLLATLTKETFAVTWVAVLAAVLYRHLERAERPGWCALRSSWRLLVPHLLAMLAVGAFVVGLGLAYEPRANYAVSTVAPYLPPVDFLLTYWTVLQPALVRGLLVPTLTAGIVALGLALACSPASRRGLGRAYAEPRLWLLVGGLVLAVVGHGLVYFLAKRTVDDTRYLLPANYLLCLAIAVALAPLGRCLTARAGALVGLAVSLAAAGALLWRLGRLNELAIIGLFLAGLVALLVGAVVLVRRGPRHLATALYAGVAALLLVPSVDYALNNAGTFRVNGEARAAYDERLRTEAPPNGHVVLRVAEPYMIEDVWATEATTLLAGRLDLTYHLEVENLSRLANDNGLVRSLIDAYNTGRQPLPATDADVLVVRANRDGMKRSVLQRRAGYDALLLLLQSPAAFMTNRYIEGHAPAWVYELSRGRPAG